MKRKKRVSERLVSRICHMFLFVCEEKGHFDYCLLPTDAKCILLNSTYLIEMLAPNIIEAYFFFAVDIAVVFVKSRRFFFIISANIVNKWISFVRMSKF